MEFDGRSAAIQHYKVKHAEHSVFCYLCELPVTAVRPEDFEKHYEEFHENMEMPFSFDTKPSDSKDSEVQMNKVSN